MPIINRVNNLIAQVKKKILGNETEKDLNERRKRLLTKYEKFEKDIEEIHLNTQMKKFFQILNESDKLFSLDMLILIENILTFLNEIEKLLINGKRKLSTNIFDDFINIPLQHMIKYLFANNQYRNFAEQQLNDIQLELQRIRRLIYIETLVSSLNQKLNKIEQEGIDSMQYLTKKIGPFTLEDQLKFDNHAKALEHLGNLPGLGITDRERIAIVSALSLSKGHWFVCPKGHPYVIDDV